MRSELDDDRYATQRATQLARGTLLRKVEAEAVAYSERGYSRPGIANKMDSSKGTIQKYHEKALALYGMQATGVRTDGESPPPVPDQVEPGYHQELVDPEQKRWLTYVDRHRNNLPQSWVHEVLDAARDDLPLARIIDE
jgi:hypothetical protein